MASSAMGGDRRGGFQRRGGMMFLGKVAVPKPINLPSQRLENHGVDPNVEIVPKGTVSWGSRPSSSSQNAWGSLPALSSSPTDGSVRHGLSNGRPSSGGSGTRPSTAGSEKSHDPASGAWGGSSRPSSASGLLASSLSPGSLRPRSAEARPSSSQLSRFAESVGENSVAWGGSGHTERLSSSSSFTLSSGDFPTLGSEKSSEANLQQGHNSHGRPSSSSGRVVPQDKASFASADDGYSETTGEKGVSPWKREEPQYHTTRSQPNIEKWREDSQEAMGYANRNVPPQGFEQWHSPAVPNAAFHGSSWCRGGPPPGPYGPVGPPGHFPVDSPHFGFYHPPSQVPVQPMPNQQNSTRPGLAAGGPPNGDPYRPHLPESYPVLNHPMMPVRYPGPMPPYDNYSGPSQMKFCEQSERDSSVLGMAGGPRPCFYPRYPGQVFHPEADNLRGRPSGYSPAAKGQAEGSHVHDPGHRGPYKVLLKQHDGLVASGADEMKISGSTQQLEKGNVEEASPKRKNDWEANSIKGDKVMENAKTTRDGASSQPNLISETMQEHNANEENVKKLEGAQLPSDKKNKTLIDKIEGLNSKSRLPDGRNALGPPIPIREDTVKRSKNIGEASSGVASTEKAQRVNLTITPSPKEASNVNNGDGSCEITFGAMPRLDDTPVEVVHEGSFPQKRAVHGMHGNMDSKGRAKLSSQENEEWKRRSAANSGSSLSVMKNFEVSSQDIAEKQVSYLSNMTENEFDSADYKAQRAKSKEIASQRAKQLQKEEEERTRDQKAKALAKLEELNRRTLGENATHKPSSCKLQPKQEDAQMAEMRNMKSAVIDGQSCDSTQTLNLPCQNSKNITHKNSELNDNPATKTTKTSSLPVPEVAANILFGSTSQAVGKSLSERSLQMHDSGSLKQKVVGISRRKIPSSGDNYQGDVLIATGHTDKVSFQATESASSESISVDDNSFGKEDSSGQHRKKHSRSFKGKHKVDEASRESCVMASAPVEGKAINLSGESGDRRDAVTVVHQPKTVLVTDPSELQNFQEVNQAAEKAVKKQIEDTHSRKMGNQGRLSSSRKALKNSQAVRPIEKSHGNENFMWAPVQQPNKQQHFFERAGQVEGNQSTQSSRKAVNGLGNSMEGKRAEMEVEDKQSNLSSGKSVSGIGSNMKAKRAEMERYIPKPVAKDLSLQSNTQQPPLPSSLTSISDEMGNSVKNVSEVGGTSSVPPIINIESKHNKHGKKHASWRQRNVNESHDSVVHSIDESAISFGVDTAFENSKDQQASKFETESRKHQEHGGHMGEETDKVMSNVLGHGLVTAKGHVGSGRGRRQPNRLFRSGGHYQNVNEELNKDSSSGIPVKLGVHNIPVEAQLQDCKINTTPENSYGMGEIKPQWQPKYPKQQHVLNEIQQGNQGSGSQKITDGGMNPSEDGSLHIQSAESPLLVAHELSVPETISSSCVETKLERTGKNLREESHKYSSQGATENYDHHIGKQHFSWGRKQSQHGGRFQRGHRGSSYGGNGGWGGPMQEVHKQQPHLSGDRRKPSNSHFEYQPVESHNKKPDNSFSGSSTSEEARHEVSSSSGPRYKEQGQNASKHGAHYQEKNSGGAVPSRVAAS